MEEHGYHFVATVDPVPARPLVEFRLVQDDVDRVVGTGERSGDTWDLNWQIPEDFPSGPHEVEAILFSGQEEVARDSMAADLDKSFAAIRIDYPVNASAWGVYIPPGDDQVWAGLIDFTYSSDVRFVDAFYTLTPPGEEPAWSSCGRLSGLSDGPAQGRIRCTLSSDHDGRDVTGVMLVPDETPPPSPSKAPGRLFEGASDAHRVHPYFQRAETVEVGTEDDARTFQRFACTSLIEVFVRDQLGVAIPRMNVDAHATGPPVEGGFSGLRFDTSTASDPNQAPDQNHGTSTAGWSCSGNDHSGNNGNHPNPDSADTRHIESLRTGSGQRTDDQGRFTFRLRSDVSGGTQITVWADRDDDDLFCAAEAAGHNSIGWEIAPPDPSGHIPTLSDCADPEPPRQEPSPTPTGSPDGDPRGCTITGTEDDDRIVGTEGDDTICAEGGDDFVDAQGGDDVVFGGAGADTILGGAGRDDLRGGGAKDTIRGGAGNDVLRGGNKNDLLVGGDGNDRLLGQNGFDTLKGNAGNDELIGASGNDALQGGGGGDLLKGGTGADLIKGFTGNDRLRGGADDDVLKGARGDDNLKGHAGDDFLDGGPDDDTCGGGRGRDTIRNCE